MNPPRVRIRPLHVQPQTFALDDLGNVAVKELGYLCRSYIGLAQHRSDRRDGRDAFAQCSGQSILPVLAGVIGGSGRLARHDLQRVTPRKLQIMQTNVPQSAHG
jgi:hypothetical protein